MLDAEGAVARLREQADRLDVELARVEAAGGEPDAAASWEVEGRGTLTALGELASALPRPPGLLGFEALSIPAAAPPDEPVVFEASLVNATPRPARKAKKEK